MCFRRGLAASGSASGCKACVAVPLTYRTPSPPLRPLPAPLLPQLLLKRIDAARQYEKQEDVVDAMLLLYRR